MDTLSKLHAIEEVSRLYSVHYCNAGVGFQFYEPPDGADPIRLHEKDLQAFFAEHPSGARRPEVPRLEDHEWKRYLVIHRYYPDFEAAVDAEFARLLPSEARRVGGH